MTIDLVVFIFDGYRSRSVYTCKIYNAIFKYFEVLLSRAAIGILCINQAYLLYLLDFVDAIHLI